MPLASDILASPRKVYLLHSHAAFDAFEEAPAAAKVLLYFWENCHPCKQYTPIFMELPPLRDIGDQPALNEYDIPIIISTDQDIIYGAVERKHDALIKERVPQFPFHNGFPTPGLLRGNGPNVTEPNRFVDKLIRNSPEVFYANIEALLPGTLDKAGPTQSIDAKVRATAKTLVPQLLIQFERQKQQKLQQQLQQQQQQKTAGASASEGAKNLNGGENGPLDVKGLRPAPYPLPAAETLGAVKKEQFATVNTHTHTETHWVHRFHPKFQDSPTNRAASEIIALLQSEYSLPWMTIPDETIAATPAVTVYVRPVGYVEKRKLEEHFGPDAIVFLNSLRQQLKSVNSSSATKTVNSTTSSKPSSKSN